LSNHRSPVDFCHIGYLAGKILSSFGLFDFFSISHLRHCRHRIKRQAADRSLGVSALYAKSLNETAIILISGFHREPKLILSGGFFTGLTLAALTA
jgi:hypothetical protein